MSSCCPRNRWYELNEKYFAPIAASSFQFQNSPNKMTKHSISQALRAFVEHCADQQYSERHITRAAVKKGWSCSRTRVRRILRERREGVSINPTPRQRRPPLLDDRARRHLRRSVRQFNERSAMALYKGLRHDGFGGSYSTVWRTVKKLPSLRRVRPRRRQFLTEDHRRLRLEWAREWRKHKKTLLDAYYMDCKWWNPGGPEYRPALLCDRLDPVPILPRNDKRYAAVSCIACISQKDVTPLEPIRPHYSSRELCSYLEKAFEGRRVHLFVDNQSANKSAETKEWCKVHNIILHTLSTKGADTNPVENLWAILSRQVFPGTVVFHSRKGIWEALQREWGRIAKNKGLLKNLVRSVPRRLEQIVERRGWHADY